MSSDLTFITNEKNQSLQKRFAALIKDTRFFDVLVGYFYVSGFHALYPVLKKTEKIRILIGISTDPRTYGFIEEARIGSQTAIDFSSTPKMKNIVSEGVIQEMEHAPDTSTVEEGVNAFREWLRSKKMEIKVYPSEKIHAKVYIMTFSEGDRDKGRVITGSSNFSKSGLSENLEFNVELKNRSDYDYALGKFNSLWKDAVDVSEQYVETLEKRTHLNDTITPYDLYLKFLYEYFKDELGRSDSLIYKYLPERFKELEYQLQAVLNAKKILEEYGGVFLSDVVGLGKTFMAALLAQQLPGRHLVLAKPALIDVNNPGSWRNVFSDFKEAADFESIGMLDHVIRRGTEKYDNVFIDEAHYFRSESNQTYEKLARICRGKRVILVTATPYNNKPSDILSQIKLFQKAKSSTIPNLPDLESFFKKLEKNLKGLDRKKDFEEYMRIVKENSRSVREKVLKYLMVRRTRSEIEIYYGEDLKKQGMAFPKVTDPEAVYYQFNSHESEIFQKTISLIGHGFTYARYMPMLYYKGKIGQAEQLAQKNVGKFMKILLVKRLESSFYAFKNSLQRFIHSYEQFLKALEGGRVYISKDYSNKIFEFLEQDDDAAIQKLIDRDKAQAYEAKDFRPDLKKDVEADLAALRSVLKDWESITRDPKLLKFLDDLHGRKIFQENKLIVFTESRETAEYLAKNIGSKVAGGVLCYHGSSGAPTRDKVIENFDARVRTPKDDCRVLVTTEVLSEGVNLHRSNVVINYDIPWNPTRLMQRVGRINRVDTDHKTIYTFNFFPTEESNDEIKLKEAAQFKIHAFIEMLGNDAQLLTEGEEIKSQELFERLSSKKTLTGDDDGEESELKYLEVIRHIQAEDEDTFERVKHLPKKARTARSNAKHRGSLLTFFRKGKLMKFYLSSSSGKAQEFDFFQAASLLEVQSDTKRTKMPAAFYELLERNKHEFEMATTEELMEEDARSGRDSAMKVLRILRLPAIRQYKGFPEEDDIFLQKVIEELAQGGIPKQTTKKLSQALEKELDAGMNPLRILGIIKSGIPSEFLQEMVTVSAAQTAGPRQVILSEFFTA
ncbi:helicase [Candidatus Peribacteria bacterium RIFOXYC1_FULL_54_13]|nr:MAG: helicase [Candidatus Peribacteria bacterium RIFOXYA1_FULL_56_14]OGJ72917.1 MAG: helicase [Candidatus Peribacteria bacterium RIFOXYA2_FULL_55_28]OGJ76083.1 MAG: helicase [Candidatus Peribacteria bacterium RIFOXYB2_FULL_54_17]OGJ79543.1 MAG: helicase [Candidatus Peribacteria bacterium RIFOXYC1_FULL_54_13]OGJ83409.1 MAG: helicase [Candidatus Peribacteria bacterium RIFOXYD1_FULL_54_13]